MTTNEQFSIVRTDQGRRLRITGTLPAGFHGEQVGDVYLCPLDAHNAAAIRQALPWSAPQRVGMRRSFGFGDRLGLSTPGHLMAARESTMFPVLAQQSMREMQRARRTPQGVIDDVTWAVVETGYQGGYGADADHVKTAEEIDACIAAGFEGFTLDPGAYVDDSADTAPATEVEAKLRALPWDMLAATAADHSRYFAQQGLSGEIYMRAAAKYGRALARVAELNAHLVSRLGAGGFDLEVSVDETETSTTPDQHRFIALELRRLGVEFIGLAPRFVGEFQKGVDYIGDLDAFDVDYHSHASIARELGPYKLSVHSGSDKFSTYAIINRHTPQYVHVKTSGTSWVEALRVVARCDTALFRSILELAIQGYPHNRQSYHVSGRAENIPQVDDAHLPDLIDQFDARQIVHVAFGAVLERYYTPLYAVLEANMDTYWGYLHAHLGRHLAPFNS